MEVGLMDIVRSVNIEVGFLTLSSAYIELFIRGEKSGGNIRGKCSDTNSTAPTKASRGNQLIRRRLTLPPEQFDRQRDKIQIPERRLCWVVFGVQKERDVCGRG